MKNCLFESVVSSPRTVFIVVPDKDVCQQAVLSGALSVTTAVMRTGLAMRRLRGMWLPLQSLSVHFSGRLAGLPLGHLLEGGRQRRHVTTTYLHLKRNTETYFHRFNVRDKQKECRVGQHTCRQSVGRVVNSTPSSNSSPTCAPFGHSGLLRSWRKRNNAISYSAWFLQDPNMNFRSWLWGSSYSPEGV